MDAITDKQRLDMPAVQVKRFWKLNLVNVYIFHWTILPLSNLKRNVEYVKRSDKLNWTFTITKKGGSYIITITTDNYEGLIQCSVGYCRSVWSNDFPAIRVFEGTYQAVLTDSIINNPENRFLKFNILVLRFAFNVGETSRITVQPRASNDTYNTDYLKMHAERVLTQIRDSRSSYFALHGKEKTFYIHKAILAARSSYFRQYIRENCMDGETGEMKLDVKSEVMYCLITFLYTGQALLKFREELKVFEELLKKLGIKGIQALKNLHIVKFNKSTPDTYE